VDFVVQQIAKLWDFWAAFAPAPAPGQASKASRDAAPYVNLLLVAGNKMEPFRRGGSIALPCPPACSAFFWQCLSHLLNWHCRVLRPAAGNRG